MMEKYARNKELGERIERFVEKSATLVRKLPKDVVNRKFGSQYISAASSFGASYQEATEAESANDFVHKMKLSLKEAKEARYWLRLLVRANPEMKDEMVALGKELTEFIKIFSSIVGKFKKSR